MRMACKTEAKRSSGYHIGFQPARVGPSSRLRRGPADCITGLLPAVPAVPANESTGTESAGGSPFAQLVTGLVRVGEHQRARRRCRRSRALLRLHAACDPSARFRSSDRHRQRGAAPPSGSRPELSRCRAVGTTRRPRTNPPRRGGLSTSGRFAAVFLLHVPPRGQV